MSMQACVSKEKGDEFTLAPVLGMRAMSEEHRGLSIEYAILVEIVLYFLSSRSMSFSPFPTKVFLVLCTTPLQVSVILTFHLLFSTDLFSPPDTFSSPQVARPNVKGIFSQN
ncbi:hypothetical protein GT037_010175 [Alternaria burnsii]|uniref:Uncharacterized protein n=1 Tax=Alternaria burnsii TaxID=1187904 RepID=A0A8H7AZ11_9PLEO|nr:uncharacterized protein GT037_010175 [Alternaria burnsii]KAF7671653.1 hypothetical protein GT037_010175 [Alternaria burnsii]